MGERSATVIRNAISGKARNFGCAVLARLVGAKAVELGVALHMGNYFGVPNQLLMLFAVLGAALLAISGPVMWMMRRKSGLGAPKAIGSGRAIWVLASIMVVFGILFPVLGVTALFVFAVERLVLSRFAPTREWLGLAN
ncbi:PepSY domain-containing protein [Hyphococcus formosus]|uniref:PepSY domain-containing protein n=1 Tax=Hyphococcus formosus TaxID=3143534 RepID=UPI00398A7A0D